MLYNTSTPTYKEPLKTKQSGEKKTSSYSLRHWIQERRNKEATGSNNLIKQQKKHRYLRRPLCRSTTTPNFLQLLFNQLTLLSKIQVSPKSSLMLVKVRVYI